MDSKTLLTYKLMNILKKCSHCTSRTVGGRIYIVEESSLIAARFLYECGYDEEQCETGEKIIHHSCSKAVDRVKTLS